MSFPRKIGLRCFEFGSDPAMKTRLAHLVRDGIKMATAGQLAEYLVEDEEVERVGERLVVLDGSGNSAGTPVTGDTQIVTVYFKLDN